MALYPVAAYNKILRSNVTAYIDLSTKNQSFLDMHYYLEAKGIKNNSFFLILYNPDLKDIDPRNENLNIQEKRMVQQECQINFWYFIREVIRIPDQGGSVGGGAMYRLDRGTLALNFGFLHNWNMFLELPRQFGKTISAICWYLWLFLFATTNSEFMFINMKHDYSKLNLKRLKEIREALPSYLQMSQYQVNGDTRRKPTDKVETLEHPINGNKIKTLAGATSRVGASGLGRGLTMPFHWYDEFGWIKFNSDIRLAATPSFSTASRNARMNHAPYGILLTTTPGLMTTNEGKYAYMVRNDATKFDESWYDKDDVWLQQRLLLNKKSSFVHIRYTHTQLGKGDEYLEEMIKELDNNYEAVRREVLLEWAEISDACPFDREQLDIIKGFVKDSDKCKHVMLCNGRYTLYMYDTLSDRLHPPIIGVDPAGGFSKDSSAITIIDSKTTKVVGCLNCNYISIEHLAYCIYELVTVYMPSAIVNIERNGGFGTALIEKLLNTSIKKNLYYEVVEDITQDRTGINRNINKLKRSIKRYGTTNDKKTRGMMMEILKERVERHKDKFSSDIIYDELKSMEMKPNGRIEHSSTTHDDQVFSYLWALYVWYFGKNLMDNWGLYKKELQYDDESSIDEIIMDDSNNQVQIDLNKDPNNEFDNSIDATLSDMEKLMSSTMTYEQWLQLEHQMDLKATDNIRKQRIRSKWSMDEFPDNEDIDDESTLYTLPPELFDMNSDTDSIRRGQTEFNSLREMYKVKNNDMII